MITVKIVTFDAILTRVIGCLATANINFDHAINMRAHANGVWSKFYYVSRGLIILISKANQSISQVQQINNFLFFYFFLKKNISTNK